MDHHREQEGVEALPKAIWNGALLAESDVTRVVDGNHYFPPTSLVREHLRASDTRTTCGWKGVASYYHVEVAGRSNPDAAWTYPDPEPAAAEIRAHVAFWKGVEIVP